MRQHWPLAVILAVFAAAVAAEVGWGLPGQRRSELLFPGGLSDDVLAEIIARSQQRLADERDRPIPLRGAQPAAPVWDRGEALDACRRFLLYSDNPDEMLALMALARMRPSEMDFDPGMGQYGGAFLYPLGAWLKALSATGLIAEGNLAFYLRQPEAFGRIYVAGRIFVALCVAAALAVAYRIGFRLAGVTGAATAAGLTALSPAVLTWSVVLKPHAAAMLPGLLAVHWALSYYEQPSWRPLLLSAVAAGVAAGMTLSAAPLVLAALLAVWLDKRGGQRAARTLAAAALATAALLAVNPYHLISLGDRIEEMNHVRGFYAGAVSPWQPLAFLIGPMREAAGTVFLAGGLLATTVLLVRQTRRAAVLLAPLAAALLLGPLGLGDWAGDPQAARFALPVLPLAMLAVGWALDRWGPQAGRAVPGILILMLAVSLPTIVAHAMSASGHNPRYDAGEWLNRHPGIPIVVRYPPAPYRCPTAAYLDREVLFRADPSRPSFMVRSTWHGGKSDPEGGTLVFSPGDLPWWLRSPMTFADRDIVISWHEPPPEYPPTPATPGLERPE